MQYERHEVQYKGHKLVAYMAGSGEQTLLLLNGGPGWSSEYLRVPLLPLADKGVRVVAYDQLGCGESDNPQDSSLWTIERYAEEVESVRETLDLGEPTLLGHSWGGLLAMEYALTYPNHFKRLILSNTVGDIPFHLQEISRLRSALGMECVAMMQRYEAESRYNHPEYEAAVTLLNFRHCCRMDTWPDPVVRCAQDCNQQLFNHMQGPNEFYFTGNLREWSCLDRLHRIEQPTLVLSGQYDMLTPASAMRLYERLPNGQIEVLRDASHLMMYEQKERYLEIINHFVQQAAK